MTKPETKSTLSIIQDTPPAKDSAAVPSPPSVSRRHLPAWERRLPRRYVVAAVPSPNSLHLDVEVETTDTQQIRHVSALLDSGAMGLFIDATYVEQHHLTTRPLIHPIPVYNIDGTRNENITWPDTAPAGTYTVLVDLYLACGVTPTNYVVTVQVAGQPAQTYTGTLTGEGSEGEADPTQVATFDVPEGATAPTSG